MSFQRWHVSVSVIDSTSPLSRETRSAQHSRPRRGGGAGGGGTSSCRPGDDMRAISPSTARPPSPARPALPNTGNAVAGEGPGVGEHQVVVPAMTCERFRHRQRDPSSALWAPSPGGGRHRWRSIRLGGEVVRSERPWRLQAQALKGLSTLALGSHRRWIPRVEKQHHVPPLPRDPLRPTQPTPPRGRGRGWGNIKLSSRR